MGCCSNGQRDRYGASKAGMVQEETEETLVQETWNDCQRGKKPNESCS